MTGPTAAAMAVSMGVSVALLAALTVLSSMNTLMISASKGDDGQVHYSFVSVTLVTEAVKMGLSVGAMAALRCRRSPRERRETPHWPWGIEERGTRRAWLAFKESLVSARSLPARTRGLKCMRSRLRGTCSMFGRSRARHTH